MRLLFRHLFICFLLAFVFASCTKSDLGGGASDAKIAADAAVGNGGGSQTAGVLTAGEWNDFANWDFWKTLMANDTFKMFQTRWGFYANEKWAFTIKDANDQPVPDATVAIQANGTVLWQGKTNRFGILQILPGILSSATTGMQYTVASNNQVYASGTLNTTNRNIDVALPININAATNIDLMFVVDATGSMTDEINYLKTELLDVMNRADNQVPGTMRYASVFYRDFGDAYVTRATGFTSTKSTIVDFVKDQNADGGGDFPEAVEEALKTAMQQNWSANARARILFLILDAPVHDDQQKLSMLKEQVKLAAAKGIMIIPVSASGIDKASEFLFRFMAQATNGTYTFLTNHSGIGGAHITPTIGNYQVEFLNNLMVRLITKYGAN
jgi:von Willebrand factor type A domain